MTARSKPSPHARERILEAADRLFYRDGLRATGIDTVIAEAGIAKMTLYSHFKSKDDLIAAYLCRRDEQLRAWFESAVGRHAATSRDHVAAWFAALKEWFDSPGFRGCAFINATAELPDPAHPGRVAVANHKRLFTDLVADSLRKARVKNPRAAAKSVVMLIEGAIVAAARAGSSQAAAVAHAAARKLLGQRR